MSKNQFKVGDEVALKCGGPVMVVKGVEAAKAEVLCTWFAGTKIKEAGFIPETLKKSKE